jgi:hypothetical protein
MRAICASTAARAADERSAVDRSGAAAGAAVVFTGAAPSAQHAGESSEKGSHNIAAVHSAVLAGRFTRAHGLAASGCEPCE